ncbi:MAG: SET domain-containing protein-lysine N-methyltransferase [Bacteroidia bacterium]
MMHPGTELKFINNEIGFGVFAKEFIPKGTITWSIDALDRAIPQKDVEKLDEIYWAQIDKYCYRNRKGDFILCWDYARFVNHSFRPNCFTTPYEFEVAIKDILPGEELTDDYGYLNVTEPFVPFDEGTERKVVYPDDLLRYGKEWDQILLSVFPEVLKVSQPLRRLIKDGDWKKLTDIVAGTREMDSLTSNHFNGQLVRKA